jgi:hypothetical protein
MVIFPRSCFTSIAICFSVELDVTSSPHSGVVAELWQYHELKQQIKATDAEQN